MTYLPEPKDDGLIIPIVGEWSYDKYHFLSRYIDAFTNSMKGKDWSGLHYIDLFAGSGIVRLESTQQLVWGSPLIAAQSPYPFDKIHVCEKDNEKVNALEKRLRRKCPGAQIVSGDANEKIHEIISSCCGKRKFHDLIFSKLS